MGVLIMSLFNCQADDKPVSRPPAVAGQFYTGNPDKLKGELQAYLAKGKKLHEGSVNETLGEINKVEIEADNLKKLESAIIEYDGKTTYTKNGTSLLITMKEGSTAEKLNDYCFEQGITLKKLFTHRNSLEQEFLKILREHD